METEYEALDAEQKKAKEQMEEWLNAKKRSYTDEEWLENDARYRTAKAKYEEANRKFQESKEVFDVEKAGMKEIKKAKKAAEDK